MNPIEPLKYLVFNPPGEQLESLYEKVNELVEAVNKITEDKNGKD